MTRRDIRHQGCMGCGELPSWDQHLRFGLPDALLSPDPGAPHARMLRIGDFLEAERYGSFVRCLLRVTLTQDNTVTFAVWLAVRQAELDRAADVWDQPEYADVEILGTLANAVPPWGRQVLGAPARAVVRDVDHLPYIVEGFTPLLDRVLTDVWPHEQVHAALPR